MIARLGKGNFSHAAIVLGPFVRFDATGKGIGFRVAAPHRVGHHLGRTRLVEDLSRFAGVRVLRHPGVAALTPTELGPLRQDLLDRLVPVNGLAYPPLGALGRVATAGGHAWIARVIRERPKKPLDGPFCSQLVVQLLESMGYAAFTPRRPPESVHPAWLPYGNFDRVRCIFSDPLSANADDSLTLREAQRITAPSGPLASGFTERRHKILARIELIDFFRAALEKRGTPLPPSYVADAEDAVNQTTLAVSQYEVDAVVDILQATDRLLAAAGADARFALEPSPEAVATDWLAHQPPADSFARPLTQFLDLYSPGSAAAFPPIPVVHGRIPMPLREWALRHCPRLIPYLEKVFMRSAA